MVSKGRSEHKKPHVLSAKDALALVRATSDYMRMPDRKINGKDRAEIIAEAALAKGFSSLSETVQAIHYSIVEFHKGHYEEMHFLLESPAIREYVRNEAAGTGYERAVEHLFSRLGPIANLEEKLNSRTIDWDSSSKVILNVKKDHFPEDLTMIENLKVANVSQKRER